MVVQFDLNSASGISPLDEDEQYSIIAQAPAGGQTYKQVSTPRNIENSSSYILS
jgi:hypothetical protein